MLAKVEERNGKGILRLRLHFASFATVLYLFFKEIFIVAKCKVWHVYYLVSKLFFVLLFHLVKILTLFAQGNV